MKPTFFLLLIVFISLNCFSQSTSSNLGIIPAPKSIRITLGQFVFDSRTAINFDGDETHKIAMAFQSLMQTSNHLQNVVAQNFIKAPETLVRFSSEYNGVNLEGYKIVISPKQIDVFGKGPGLFYAMQTLMQLFPAGKNSINIPCAEIVDEPRYKYRGMHLDVCRHIFPVSFIKTYIDILASYKLNTFHWHLTDDQGWRIEIKKYPKLTQVGGFRAQTLIGNYHDRMPQWFDNTPYGGFYTQQEIKEVIAYAASKFVTIIPEIEMPGHSLAALAAYPQLACNDNPGPFKTAEKWGVFEDVFCAGKENTFTFLEDVLTEVIDLFPSQYIHIGGDECPKARWKQCKYCQKRIRDNKLKNEEELQSYFIHRMEKFVNSKGRKIIGWDEILQGGLAPNATVMSWTGVNAGINAAKQNHDVIMTPGNFVYFDHLQGRSDQEPLTIGGYTPLQEVYSYNPTPESLSPVQQSHIIGVQANVWTEYMTTPEKVEYMVLPRIYALSEIAWTALNRKDYSEFSQVRVPLHLAKLDQTNFLYRVPVALGAKDTVMAGSKFSFEFKPSVLGSKIYYTIDGYNPGETDILYEKPVTLDIPVGERRLLKTLEITPSGKRSAITTTTLINELPLAPLADSLKRVNGLKYYFVPGDVTETVSIDTSKATEKGSTTALNLFKFRGKARTFGLVFNGFITIAQDGVYNFSTSSDDGSTVWIDNKQVVQNDGKHANFELNGVVNLLKGLHKIEIRYFQLGGGNELRVFVAQGSNPKTEIPAGLLSN